MEAHPATILPSPVRRSDGTSYSRLLGAVNASAVTLPLVLDSSNSESESRNHGTYRSPCSGQSEGLNQGTAVSI